MDDANPAAGVQGCGLDARRGLHMVSWRTLTSTQTARELWPLCCCIIHHHDEGQDSRRPRLLVGRAALTPSLGVLINRDDSRRAGETRAPFPHVSPSTSSTATSTAITKTLGLPLPASSG